MKGKILGSMLAMLMVVTALPAIPTNAAAETDYYVMSPTANSYQKAGGSISLTWRNPAAELSKVSLYQMNNDGTETLLDGELVTESGVRQIKTIEELDAEQIYQYKVVSEFADGHATTSVILSSDAAALKTDNFKASGSGLGIYSGKQFGKRVSGTTDKTPEYYIDPEVKYAGTASLHIKNNYAEANAVFTFDTGALTAGTNNYTLSGYVKANKYKPQGLLGYFSNSSNPTWGTLTNSEAETTCDWQEFSIPISGDNTSWDSPFVKMVFAQYPAEDLWIDNLKLVENATGTDVFEYLTDSYGWIGGFENYVAPASPAATAVQSDDKVTINIDVPDDSRKLYVYETIGNTDIVRAVLDKSVTTIELEGVKGTLKVSSKSGAKSSQNVMSEKAEVKLLKETDYYAYAPTFSPAATDGTKAEISWRNPPIACSKVSLYDVTNPLNPVLISDECSTAAEEGVTVTAEDLTPDQQYIYKVIYEFADHDATSMIIGGYADQYVSKTSAISGSGWSVHTNAATKNAVAVNIDTNVKASGNASLHISSNGLSYGNTWLRHQVDAANIVSGKVYVLSLKVKADQYIPRESLIGMVYQQGWWQYIKDKTTGPFDYDWLTISKEITISATDKDWPFVDILVPRMTAKDMWIDDITFCEKGTTDNIISGGGFESYVDAFDVTAAAVQSVGDGSATIGYTIPAGTQAVYIYQKVGNKLIQRANVSELESVTIDGLQNGEENELVIKTLSTGYVLSSGVTVTAVPVASGYRTGYYKLYKGTQQITKAEPGEMTVKLDVTNLAMGSNFTPCYIVALYDGARMVDCVVSDDVTIGEGETKTLSASVTVGADMEDCKVKAFLWRDYETMGILKANGEF